MSGHIINNNTGLNFSKSCMDDSPCLACKYRDTEGGSCALLCLRLAAHSSGEPWEDQPLPYIAKQKTRKSKKGKDMENNTEAKDQKPICEMPNCSESAVVRGLCQKDYDSWRNGMIEHPRLGIFKKTVVSVIEKGICEIEGCDEKIFVRGLCSSHYQSWRKGHIEHPILGIYTVSQAKSHFKKPKPGPETTEQKIPDQKAAKRSYPFPDLVTLDFSKYPEIKAVIFETAQKLLLPTEHIAVSLISEGIMAKIKKS